MHVIVPTSDFIRLMSKLKPMKSLVPTGFMFPMYTIEAKDKKIRLIVSDNATITAASSEIFADVKDEGIISVNGADFIQLISKIPHTNSPNLQSQALELIAKEGFLTVSTVVDYSTLGASVVQTRTFMLVDSVLSARDDFDPQDPSAIRVKLPALYLSDVFRVLGKVIANYTSNMESLSGVLIRNKNKRLCFTVSDGYRIIEIAYPEELDTLDFDIIIPKLTCTVMQSIISDGDSLELWSDGHQVKFVIDNAGLRTRILSAVINRMFPPYSSIFEVQGTIIRLNTKMFSDNIANVRKAIDEDPYRIRILFYTQNYSISNYGHGHVTFKNEGIPLLVGPDSPMSLVINAVLLDTSLGIIGSDNVQITIPPDKKPIVVDNLDDSLRIRIAIALVDDE